MTMTSSDYVTVVTAVDKLYSTYLDFGLEVARKQDWGAVLESLIFDAYYTNPQHSPSSDELAKVYNFVSATTTFADVSKGAEYLMMEMTKGVNNNG